MHPSDTKLLFTTPSENNPHKRCSLQYILIYEGQILHPATRTKAKTCNSLIKQTYTTYTISKISSPLLLPDCSHWTKISHPVDCWEPTLELTKMQHILTGHGNWSMISTGGRTKESARKPRFLEVRSSDIRFSIL